MNRCCIATIMLSLTLALGCQGPADVEEEDVPAPVVVTPDPTSPAVAPEASATPEPAASSQSSRALDVTATADGKADAEVVEESPPTESDFMDQLRAALGEGDLNAALVLAEQAQAAFPDSQQWLSVRSQLLIQGGRVEEGLGLLKDAYREDPEDGMLATQIIQMGLALASQAEGEARQKLTLDVVAMLGEMEEAGRLETLGPQKGRIIEIVRFSESRVHATQGDLEAAKHALQLAFAEGFRELEMLRTDEAFAELLEQEDIAQLVAAREEEIRLEYLAEAREALKEGESFPFGFSLNDTTGNPVAMEDFAGKVLIVDFWGTWCPPCRKEIPNFIKLQETYGDDLAIVGINYEHGADDEENIQLIEKFAETVGLEYPCLLGDDATQDQVPNLQGFPTTLFLDRAGEVRLTTVGYRSYGQLDAIVSVLLEEQSVEAASEASGSESGSESAADGTSEG